MQPEDRPIHFSTELFHPPAQHERDTLQKLYYELSCTEDAVYDNSDFSLPHGQCRFFSKRGRKTQSLMFVLPDRVVLAEEWVDIPMSTFTAKLKAAAPLILHVLGIEKFQAQSATVRTTFGLTHFEDARPFMIEQVCGQKGRVKPYFNRPLHVGGMRFVFPETRDHPGTINVTIESFHANPRELYVEGKGMFMGVDLTAGQAEEFPANVEYVRSFINEKVFPFVNQYDTPVSDE
jgi:hypothetical protein